MSSNGVSQADEEGILFDTTYSTSLLRSHYGRFVATRCLWLSTRGFGLCLVQACAKRSCLCWKALSWSICRGRGALNADSRLDPVSRESRIEAHVLESLTVCRAGLKTQSYVANCGNAIGRQLPEVCTMPITFRRTGILAGVLAAFCRYTNYIG